ncbi:MAG: hypothetical protein J5966_05425, partial [Lachnospiraceae bacterium]|nr:hypothetical protein [Lachnospiraceae bacterium]
FKLICSSFNDEEIKTVTARDVLSKLNRPYDKDEDSLLCAMHSVIISEHIRKMIKISVETVTESCKDLGYSQRIARLEKHAKNKEAEADKAGQEALEARKTLENRITEACRDRDSRISELAGKNDRLTAKLQEKDTEIAELKQRLKEQSEKLEHMKRESKNSVKQRWTPDDFRDKRLLFASYDIDRNLNVIKKMFPDAYYLEDEAAPISGIKADAVIIMGSSISHSLCYKLESAFPRDSIMTYRGRNAERFCDELGKWFERKERNGKKEELAG